jgi:hypothetical protein
MTVQAGLLTCGSSPFSAFPGKEKPSGIVEKNSPPTVAGAVAELAKPHRIPILLISQSANLNTRIIGSISQLSIQPVALSHLEGI